MNGNDCCTHQRLLRVIIEESMNDAVFKCESCNRQYGVTLSDVTMKSVSSSSSSHNMEVDRNNTKGINANSTQNHQLMALDVTMRTAVSSGSSHNMEVDVYSTGAAVNCQPTQHQQIQTSKLADEFDDLNEIIGQGGYGSVSKYKKKSDGKSYAIKRTEVNDDGRDIKREVEALSKLDHKNIVRYYSCWDEPSINNGKVILHIQMDFCEKGTLRGAINSRELALNRFRMWKLFRQIVEGIKYFHSKDVIHRDLKVW